MPPTLTAPAPKPSASEPMLTVNQIIEDDSFFTDAAAPPPEPAPEPERPRNDKGQFVKADEEVKPELDTEAEPDTEVVSEPETVVSEPETVEAEPEKAPEPKRPLATQFTVYDPEGEVDVPEVEIEFKANGEVRKMPLDKVVRLAQSGFYNEQLQQEVKESRGKVGDIEARLHEAEQRAERQIALMRQVFESEDAYLQRRDEYQRMNSPEERNRRLESELSRERALRQQEQWSQQAVSFLQGDLEPKVSGLLQQYPSVSDTEAAGWLAPQLKGFEVQGVIPPSRYGDVRRLIENDLAEYMSQVHLTRTSTAKAADTKRQVELRKAKVETTLAKRELTKVASPAARAGAATGTPALGKKERQQMSADQISRQMFRELGFGDTDEE